eukprot:g3934.t1
MSRGANGFRSGGTRGGRSEFKWEDVKSDKYRECYLGHSVHASVGRWQKNKDLMWYTRAAGSGGDASSATSSAASAALAEERRAARERDEDMLNQQLGVAPKRRRAVPAGELSAAERRELVARGGTARDGLYAERVGGLGVGEAKRHDHMGQRTLAQKYQDELDKMAAGSEHAERLKAGPSGSGSGREDGPRGPTSAPAGLPDSHARPLSGKEARRAAKKAKKAKKKAKKRAKKEAKKAKKRAKKEAKKEARKHDTHDKHGAQTQAQDSDGDRQGAGVVDALAPGAGAKAAGAGGSALRKRKAVVKWEPGDADGPQHTRKKRSGMRKVGEEGPAAAGIAAAVGPAERAFDFTDFRLSGGRSLTVTDCD